MSMKFSNKIMPRPKKQKKPKLLLEHASVLLENWPPQSPDINIIENIWHILKLRVSQRCPKNLEELFNFAQEEFARVPNEFIKRLYDPIPKRLSLVFCFYCFLISLSKIEILKETFFEPFDRSSILLKHYCRYFWHCATLFIFCYFSKETEHL